MEEIRIIFQVTTIRKDICFSQLQEFFKPDSSLAVMKKTEKMKKLNANELIIQFKKFFNALKITLLLLANLRD